MIRIASGETKKIDISTEDIQQFKEFGQHYLEHLSELLLNPENPRQQASLFGLVFETFPTYEEIINGTPKLSWIFELSSKSATAESVLVSLRSLDWNTIESTVKRWNQIFNQVQKQMR